MDLRRRADCAGFGPVRGFPRQCVSSTICATSNVRTRHARMHAFVYKSQRRADTFVYLAARDDFERIPAPLRDTLGALTFVLDVALTPGRKLAREDAEVVRENLATRGFHLQLPPPPVPPSRADG